jgi:hypothetical protein
MTDVTEDSEKRKPNYTTLKMNLLKAMRFKRKELGATAERCSVLSALLDHLNRDDPKFPTPIGTASVADGTIADEVGLTREGVCRIRQWWKKAGVLDWKRGRDRSTYTFNFDWAEPILTELKALKKRKTTEAQCLAPRSQSERSHSTPRSQSDVILEQTHSLESPVKNKHTAHPLVGFVLPEDDITYATERDFTDVPSIFQEFLNHHIGRGTRVGDCSLLWRSWIDERLRRRKHERHERQSGRHGRGGFKTDRQRYQELLESLRDGVLPGGFQDTLDGVFGRRRGDDEPKMIDITPTTTKESDDDT